MSDSRTTAGVQPSGPTSNSVDAGQEVAAITGSSSCRPRNTLETDIRSYLLGRILLAGAGFLSIPLINRGVGVENYGLISLWTTISCWVPQIAAGWLQQSTLRYHSFYREMDNGSDYRRTVNTTAWILAFVATLSTFGVMQFAGRLSLQEIGLTALLAGGTVLHMVYSAIAQAELRAPRVVIADLFRTVLPIVLFGIHFAAAHSVSRTMTLLYFLVGMAVASGTLVMAARTVSERVGSAVPSVLRKMFVFGLPMGIWFGLSTGQMLVGRLILQHLHLSAALGLFTTFQDFFAKTGTVLFMPVTYAVHGQVMALWSDRKHVEARSAIRRATLYQIVLGAALALAAAALYGGLSRFLLGSAAGSFDTRSTAFLLMVGVVAANLSLISHKGMELGERTAHMAVLMGLALLINGGLSLWFARLWGGAGVAAALLAANVFYLVATFLCSRRVLCAAEDDRRTEPLQPMHHALSGSTARDIAA